jgi:hypothetical protein
MPNHFHGIVIINHVGAYGDTPLQSQTNVQFKSPSKTIGAIVRAYRHTPLLKTKNSFV